MKERGVLEEVCGGTGKLSDDLIEMMISVREEGLNSGSVVGGGVMVCVWDDDGWVWGRE